MLANGWKRATAEEKLAAKENEELKKSLDGVANEAIPKLTEKQKRLAEKTKKTKEEFDKFVRSLNSATPKETYNDIIEDTDALLDKITDTYTKKMPKPELAFKVKPLSDEEKAKIAADLEALKNKTQGFADAAMTAFSGIGSAVVATMGQAESGIQQFQQSMAAMVIDIIAQQLAASTANAITGATGAAAVAGPLAPAVLPITIASMVGTTIAAFAAIPAFADGGVISGPTMGLMGEYAGARNNPEVVAPLDKLQAMISNNGGGMAGDVTFRIEGTTLVGVLKRTDKSMKYSN